MRFVEVAVNGPKTRSLAAALHPEIADVQVPVEEIEAAVVRHTSRTGDPHRRLHLQINARVWTAGRWRGIHTVGVRDSLDAISGIGHAAVMCDPEFRAALAKAGRRTKGCEPSQDVLVAHTMPTSGSKAPRTSTRDNQ